MTSTISAPARRLQGVYLITDDAAESQLFSTVHAALAGGVKIIQYRDKQRNDADKLRIALRLKQLCHDHAALFIINDSIQLTQNSQADGIHLGQGDASLSAARAALGKQVLIGVSTRTPELAAQAEQQGADYIGVGSVYPTTTKNDAVHIGVAGLRAVRAAVSLPIIAIGGINHAGLPAVIEAGADGAAVVSAIMNDPQPALAARELGLLFQRRQPRPCGRVLTIAGSDSGGGAGIQADIKTITLLGSYASSVITALTAQNTLGVTAIHAVPVSFIEQQLQAVLSDIGTDVIKTGMLFNSQIIAAVAAALEAEQALAVIDPVMIAKGGANLLQQQAVDAFIRLLLDKAYLLTPNIPEAQALTGLEIDTVADMEAAARQLQQMGARNVLIKGGHLRGDPVDLLFHAQRIHLFSGQRIASRHTHGTGCTTASAIATLLAQGKTLPEAIALSKQFIELAIAGAMQLGHGHGPVNHYTAALTLTGYPAVTNHKD